MKAIAQRSWASNAPLELVELPTPTPGAGELRVAVRAIGVNPVDWKLTQAGLLRWAARLFGPPAPVVPGVDFAGVVDAIGPGVSELAVGDSVVGGVNVLKGQRGSYADSVVVPAEQLCRVPAGVSLDVAAALPVPGVTAWMALVEIARVGAGARVLVLGASGGVGQMSLQLAKVRGATVVGVCSSKNVALVRRLGADHVIDYRAADVFTAARGHGPYQAVIDCVGDYSASRCRALLARGGRHVMVAGDSPRDMVQVLVPPFTSRSLLGVMRRDRLQPMLDAVAAGTIQVSIVERLPLTEAAEAHRLSQSGRVAGKIVLQP
jgi:NADPH:quinone reductase-like Zn-dependent oxidoreductase